MEATAALMDARNRKDPAAEAKAKTLLAEVRRERAQLDGSAAQP
jgi:hypothetical protein